MTTQNEETKEHHRRLSLPNLVKLREEWDKREAVQTTLQLPPGKLQVRIKFDRQLLYMFTYMTID